MRKLSRRRSNYKRISEEWSPQCVINKRGQIRKDPAHVKGQYSDWGR